MTIEAAAIVLMLVCFGAFTALVSRRPVDGASVLIMAMFAYAVLPPLIQVLMYGRTRLNTADAALTGALPQKVAQLLLYLVLLVAAFALTRIDIRVAPRMLVFLGPWVALTISTFIIEHHVSLTSLIYPLVGLIVVSSADRKRALLTIAYLTMGLATVALLSGVLAPSAALFAKSKTTDKAIIGDKLLAGPLLHPNTLGQALVLGAPFLLLIPNRATRRVGYVLVLIALLWASSRTAMLALAVAVLVVVAFRVRTAHRSSALRNLATGGLWIAFIGAVVIGPILVATSNIHSFTDRGVIWISSLGWWEHHPLIGNGAQFYSEVIKVTDSFGTNAFHGHNIGVHMLATSGIIGAAAILVLFLRLLHQGWVVANTTGTYAVAAFAIALVVDCWLEVPTDFFTLGSMSWLVWVPVAMLCSGPFRGAQPGRTTPTKATTTAEREIVDAR